MDAKGGVGATAATDGGIDPRRLVQRVATSYSWAPFVAILVGYTLLQVAEYGADLGQWDVLVLSAWATVAIGLALAQTVPERLQRTLVRLADRGAIEASDAKLGAMVENLRKPAATWGWWLGAVGALAIGGAFWLAFPGGLGGRIVLVVLAIPAGYVVGFQLGRMASYGRLGHTLHAAGVSVRLTPGHLDQVGGLKPVGEFFFFQAMVAAIPAVFLAAWLVLIPLKGERYEYWRKPYLGLLALAIVAEILAFVVPMWSFHREMSRQKVSLLREADRLSSEIATVSRQLATAAGEEAAVLKERLATVTERYWSLENLPTWPVDVKTRRRFRMNNLALFLPLAGKLVGSSPVWKELSDVLRTWGE